MESEQLVTVASALASPSRAAIVGALMSGTAHTGRELARHVGVAPSTASEHLGVLIDAGLVEVEAQGRSRYFRLASRDVATFVESALALAAATTAVPRPRPPTALAFARSCYDHLAGELGVRLYGRLVESGALSVADGEVALTPAGARLLEGLEIDVYQATTRRPLARTCLDWTQRRHHLAGALGAALLGTMLDQGWLRRHPGRRRELHLTAAGRGGFTTYFGVEI